MGSLEELLSNINSGAVDVTVSDAVKRQPRKPKAQTDLQKRLRGQAGAVNTTQAAKAAEKRGSAANRATSPPAPSAASGATAAAPGSGGSSAPPSSSSAPTSGPPPATVAPAGPPPLAPNAPLTMRLKRVLDLLRSNRSPHSFADLRSRLAVDLSTDSELLEQLITHTQVSYDRDSRALRYRPKVPGINNATDLLNYLRRHTTVEGASSAVPMTGVRLADVADAYLGILEDVKKLQTEGSIYVFGNTGPGQDTLYAVSSLNIGPISDPIVELFHSTRLPQDVVDLQWRAKDLGLKSALASRPVRQKADDKGDKKKKRRKVERRFNVDKATNAHMRELFEGAQPKNIDSK